MAKQILNETIPHLFADNKGLRPWMKAIQPLIKASERGLKTVSLPLQKKTRAFPDDLTLAKRLTQYAPGKV